MVAPAPRLGVGFVELGEYGKNPGRETRALESNVKRSLLRVEGFVNEVLAAAVMLLARRSPFEVQAVKAANFQALGGTGVIPVNLVDTTSLITVTLPVRAPNLVCIVKDATGDAASNNITVQTPEALVNIDGSPSADTIATAYACRWYVCDADGTEWWVAVRN